MKNIQNFRGVTEKALSLGNCLKNVLVIVIINNFKKGGID